MEEWIDDSLPMDHLQIDMVHIHLIGSGKFGKVYKVRSNQTGEIYAAKHVECRRKSERKRVADEVSILRELNHATLLRLEWVYQDTDNIVQIFEYLDGGELLERIVSCTDRILTEFDIAGFIQQILTGVAYLHERRIVHLDLKPENVVCVDTKSFNLKIVDFGLARRLDSDHIYVMQGTPDFVSPEVVKFEPVHTGSDMWSVGVLTYVLLSGLSPFLGDTNIDTFNNITSLNYTFNEEEFEGISECGKDLIERLLRLEPAERLTAREALSHPWIVHKEGIVDRTRGESDWRVKSKNLKKMVTRTRWVRSVTAVQACNRLVTGHQAD